MFLWRYPWSRFFLSSFNLWNLLALFGESVKSVLPYLPNVESLATALIPNQRRNVGTSRSSLLEKHHTFT